MAKKKREDAPAYAIEAGTNPRTTPMDAPPRAYREPIQPDKLRAPYRANMYGPPEQNPYTQYLAGKGLGTGLGGGRAMMTDPLLQRRAEETGVPAVAPYANDNEYRQYNPGAAGTGPNHLLAEDQTFVNPNFYDNPGMTNMMVDPLIAAAANMPSQQYTASNMNGYGTGNGRTMMSDPLLGRDPRILNGDFGASPDMRLIIDYLRRNGLM